MVTVTKRIMSVVLALVLTIAFMPTVAWSSAVPQAFAEDGEAPFVPPAAADAAQASAHTITPQDDPDFDDTIFVRGDARYDFAHEVLKLVNEEREKEGLSPMVLDYDLTEAAMQRSAELSLFFSHTRPNGKDCLTAISSNGGWTKGENIAAGMWGSSSTPESVMENWMNSPGHRANILNANFTAIGIGCFDSGPFFWTQLFSAAGSTGPVPSSPSENLYRIDIDYFTCGMRQGFNLNYDLDSKSSLTIGETFEMQYGIKNDGWDRVYCVVDASSATWTSSNSSVCTVDANGVVTAKAVGTATITATLKGSMTKVFHEWKVTESLDNATIAPIPDQTYTGNAITPLPTVTLGGKTLVKDRDYTVRYVTNSYINNIDVRDNVTLVIEGIGNYSGSKNATFKIVPAKITSATLSQTESVYDGSKKTPTVTVKAGNKTLEPYSYSAGKGDYYINAPNLTDAGEKTFTIQGRGNYTGTLEVKYTIKPASITLASVSLSETKFIYDGYWKEPDVTVKMGNKTLDEWWDYSVSYPNDTYSVGKKTLTIIGRGNYTGSAKATYEVVEASSPDTPTNPSNPSTPDTPNNPSNPNKPSTPDTPTQPSNPEAPGEPDAPEVATNAMFRLYNPNSGEHFYTASTVERDHLVSLGWQDEGVGWIAPTEGNAVYRLYNPYAGEHHYTLSAAERDMLVGVGWNDEGIGWYSDPNQGVPLFRVYNPNEYANNHHYTTSAEERDFLLSIGWQDEGVSWHGVG